MSSELVTVELESSELVISEETSPELVSLETTDEGLSEETGGVELLVFEPVCELVVPGSLLFDSDVSESVACGDGLLFSDDDPRLRYTPADTRSVGKADPR